MIAKYAAIFWLCFISGVAIASVYEIRFAGVAVAAAPVILLLAVWWVSHRTFSMFVCAGIGLCLGAWHVNLTFQANEFESVMGSAINRDGSAVSVSVSASGYQQITIRPDGYMQSVRVQLYQPIDVSAGDRVWIRGVLTPPENFDTFDYVGYLQRYDVYALLKKPKVIVLAKDAALWRKPIRFMRMAVIRRSEAVLSERARGLVLGMLIGDRQFIPPDVSDSFKRVGMTHIVAVSGYNINIIAAACSALAWCTSRRFSGVFTVLTVIAFSLIAGGTASVVRAAIMALLVVTAQLSGRMYTSMYALVWAAGLMVVQNPRIVLWDVGFQLSVAATAGVLYSYQLRDQESDSSVFSDTLRPTLGAIIATAPLIAYHFEVLSIVSPIVNVLLLPLVPWIMLFGALALLPGIGAVCGAIASLVTAGMINAVAYFASISFSTIGFSINAWALIIYYLCLPVIVRVILRKKRVVLAE